MTKFYLIDLTFALPLVSNWNETFLKSLVILYSATPNSLKDSTAIQFLQLRYGSSHWVQLFKIGYVQIVIFYSYWQFFKTRTNMVSSVNMRFTLEWILLEMKHFQILHFWYFNYIIMNIKKVFYVFDDFYLSVLIVIKMKLLFSHFTYLTIVLLKMVVTYISVIKIRLNPVAVIIWNQAYLNYHSI